MCRAGCSRWSGWLVREEGSQAVINHILLDFAGRAEDFELYPEGE